ncbi:MAG: hypothetical protein ACOCV1_07675 [Bacillota bacterium]
MNTRNALIISSINFAHFVITDYRKEQDNRNYLTLSENREDTLKVKNFIKKNINKGISISIYSGDNKLYSLFKDEIEFEIINDIRFNLDHDFDYVKIVKYENGNLFPPKLVNF